MDLERYPSGISYYVRHSTSGSSLVERGVDETQPQHFRTAGIPIDGEQHKRYLPLLEVSQNVEVIGATARTLLAQTFVNISTTAIQEANYCFPLYDGSVIISFRCWLNGKPLLEGKVKPKAAAKDEYRDAVARHRVAALLEEHTPEIFETVIGNIPPRTTVKVEITYVNELKADTGGDGILVTIPTSIAPRYGTPPTRHLETTASSSLRTVQTGLKIKIEVSASAPIQKLESLTHPISVELGSEGHPTRTDRFGNLAARGFDPKKATASLSDRTAVLGKDFVLLIKTSSSTSSPRALIEYNLSLPDHSVIMTTIIPREIFASHPSSQATKSEIIFVADRSGSMLDKMEALVHALRVLLQSIPKQCLFNICSFGSQHSLLWPRSRLSTPTNLDHANEHLLGSFGADLGGTELLSALETVVKQRMTEEDLRTEVIVLTDGEVWNTEATIDFVRTSRTSANDKIRFFALGIGNAVSHTLVEGIGRQGGGYAEVVAIDAHGQWESRVIRMLDGALTPSSWQCKISLEPGIEPYLAQIDEDTKSDSGELLNVQKPVCVQAPFRIPTLHAFSRLSVFFIIDRKVPVENSIKIEALASTGDTITIFLPLEKVEEKPLTIHFLAAKALMNDFETEQSWLHSKYETFKKKHPVAFEKLVRQEAESVGEQWSITGKWTSFVAIDRGNKLKNVISLCKAERSFFGELAAPLSSTLSFKNLDLRSSTYGYAEFDKWFPCSASFEGDMNRESKNDALHRSPCQSSQTGIETPIPILEKAEDILTTLIDDQTSQGFFPLKLSTRDRENVLESFRPDLLFEFEEALKLYQELMAPNFLFETVIVTVYIEKKFFHSVQRWDSVIKKAHDWVQENVKDYSIQEKLYSLVRRNFREDIVVIFDDEIGSEREKVKSGTEMTGITGEENENVGFPDIVAAELCRTNSNCETIEPKDFKIRVQGNWIERPGRWNREKNWILGAAMQKEDTVVLLLIICMPTSILFCFDLVAASYKNFSLGFLDRYSIHRDATSPIAQMDV